MLVKNLLLLFCFSALFNLNFLNAQQWKTGDKVPPVTFAAVLDNQYNKDFYKGKYLVIDFWGTWCAPCIASFPKLNALSQKFSSDNVLFAAITNEPEEKIKRFFEVKKHISLQLIKLIDDVDPVKYPEGKTFTDFRISAVPFTLIISPDGKINWVGAAHDLTEEILVKAIVNDAPTVKKLSLTDSFIQKKEQNMDSFWVAGFDIIAKTVTISSNGSMLNNFPEKTPINNFFKGAKIDFILRKYYRLPAKQVEVKGLPGTGIPLVQYSIKGNRSTSWDSLAIITSEILSKKYKFTYKVEERVSDLWQLTLINKDSLLINAAAFDSTTGKSGLGTYETNAFAINYFFHQLKDVLDQYYTAELFVVDNANIDKIKAVLFDFYIPINNWNAASVQLKRYGIKVEKVKKKLPFLILDFTTLK